MVSVLAAAEELLDLPCDQVPIASKLIIDQEGKMCSYSLLDSANIDAKLIQLDKELDRLLPGESE